MAAVQRARHRVQRLSGALGASIEGMDLRHIGPGNVQEIRSLFLEHCVIVFRDQHLTPQEHVAFAGKLGEVFTYPKVNLGDDELPSGILKLHNVGKDKVITERWHFDGMYLEKPPTACILLPRELPPYGGDTMWANQYLAYEALSPTLRDFISRLRYLYQGSRITQRYEGNDKPATAWQPMVRRHPETGRDALYVGNPDTAIQVEGLTREESEPLIRFLYMHGQRPDFAFRHVWRAGDVLMWDNRCTMHYAVHDYGDHQRLMHRVTINGDKAYGPHEAHAG